MEGKDEDFSFPGQRVVGQDMFAEAYSSSQLYLSSTDQFNQYPGMMPVNADAMTVRTREEGRGGEGNDDIEVICEIPSKAEKPKRQYKKKRQQRSQLLPVTTGQSDLQPLAHLTSMTTGFQTQYEQPAYNLGSRIQHEERVTFPTSSVAGAEATVGFQYGGIQQGLMNSSAAPGTSYGAFGMVPDYSGQVPYYGHQATVMPRMWGNVNAASFPESQNTTSVIRHTSAPVYHHHDSFPMVQPQSIRPQLGGTMTVDAVVGPMSEAVQRLYLENQLRNTHNHGNQAMGAESVRGTWSDRELVPLGHDVDRSTFVPNNVFMSYGGSPQRTPKPLRQYANKRGGKKAQVGNPVDDKNTMFHIQNQTEALAQDTGLESTTHSAIVSHSSPDRKKPGRKPKGTSTSKGRQSKKALDISLAASSTSSESAFELQPPSGLDRPSRFSIPTQGIYVQPGAEASGSPLESETPAASPKKQTKPRKPRVARRAKSDENKAEKFAMFANVMDAVCSKVYVPGEDQSTNNSCPAAANDVNSQTSKGRLEQEILELADICETDDTSKREENAEYQDSPQREPKVATVACNSEESLNDNCASEQVKLLDDDGSFQKANMSLNELRMRLPDITFKKSIIGPITTSALEEVSNSRDKQSDDVDEKSDTTGTKHTGVVTNVDSGEEMEGNKRTTRSQMARRTGKSKSVKYVYSDDEDYEISATENVVRKVSSKQSMIRGELRTKEDKIKSLDRPTQKEGTIDIFSDEASRKMPGCEASIERMIKRKLEQDKAKEVEEIEEQEWVDDVENSSRDKKPKKKNTTLVKSVNLKKGRKVKEVASGREGAVGNKPKENVKVIPQIPRAAAAASKCFDHAKGCPSGADIKAKYRGDYTEEEKAALYTDGRFVIDVLDAQKEPEDMYIWQINMSDRCLRQFYPAKFVRHQFFITSTVRWYFHPDDFMGEEFKNRFQPIEVIKVRDTVRIAETKNCKEMVDMTVQFPYVDRKTFYTMTKFLMQIPKYECLRQDFYKMLTIAGLRALREDLIPFIKNNGLEAEENQNLKPFWAAWLQLEEVLKNALDTARTNCGFAADVLTCINASPYMAYTYKDVDKKLYCSLCGPKQRTPYVKVIFKCPTDDAKKPYDFFSLMNITDHNITELMERSVYFCKHCSHPARVLHNLQHYRHNLIRIIKSNMYVTAKRVRELGERVTDKLLMWHENNRMNWKNNMFLDLQVTLAEIESIFKAKTE